MSELLKIVLSLSLSGTLLFFIILALKPLYKNKLSKRWQYYIWLIVIMRMLMPFTSETTLIGSAFHYLENTNVGTIQSAPPTNDVQSDFGLGDNYTTPNTEPQAPKTNIDTAPSFSIQAILSKVYENLWMLWAAIAFALLIRKITMYQSFVRFVKAGRAEVSDIKILNMLADAGESFGVKRPVELFINPLISSPMLLGFFRPYIILPSIELDSTELAYIMRHELTHYKYMDMLYKWFVQLTVCLHWFNPFAYLLAKEINKCCELSCDEAIIKTMDTDEKKAYGDTLLNSLKAIGNYNDKLATVTLTEGAEQLKERLDAIMKFKKKSKSIVVITLALTTMFCVGATAVGAYAAPQTANPKIPVNINTSNVTVPPSSTTPNDFFDTGWDEEWNEFDKAFSNEKGNYVPNKSNVKLINTKQWVLSGITEIEVAYVTDEVKLLPSTTQEIILKEFLSEDSPNYYANTSIVDSILKIERGERPAPSPTGYISSIEIYVPANFSGVIKLETKSGCIVVADYKGKLNCNTETGLITILDSKINGDLSSNSGSIKCTRTSIATDNGKLNCNTKSGLIIFSDSSLSGTFNTNSGMIELGITNILGDVDAHSKSGNVIANISSDASFSIKATTDTGKVINNFSNSFATSNKSLTGKWGATANHKIMLSSNSGNVEINNK